MSTLRFTYTAEYDTHGNLIGTTIKQTGGYFAGYTPEQLQAVAEKLYPEYEPEFKKNAMQSEFYEIHFNHCLRRKLQCYDGSASSLSLPLSEPAEQP